MACLLLPAIWLRPYFPPHTQRKGGLNDRLIKSPPQLNKRKKKFNPHEIKKTKISSRLNRLRVEQDKLGRRSRQVFLSFGQDLRDLMDLRVVIKRHYSFSLFLYGNFNISSLPFNCSNPGSLCTKMAS